MKTRLFLALCSFGALVVACGPRSHTPEASTSAPAKAVATTNGLATTLYADVSDGVFFSLSVTNKGGKKVELLFPGGQTHDLAVVDSTGREVWRWSNGRMFTQALQTKLLLNGQTLRYEERWENPPPGKYTVVGRLTSESHPLETISEFRVGTTLASN